MKIRKKTLEKNKTPSKQYPEVAKLENKLENYIQQSRDITKEMFTTDDGKMYTPDIFFLGIMNRTINTIDAILCLTERRNFVATGSLVRNHLDTLLCLSYLIQTKNPDSFIMEVLRGTQLRQIKDEAGIKLTDTRLREYTRPLFSQVDSVYKDTSKLVHFSDKQVFSCIKTIDDKGHFTVSIGKGFSQWKEKDIVASLKCVIAITDVIMAIARGYVLQKSQNFKPIQTLK